MPRYVELSTRPHDGLGCEDCGSLVYDRFLHDEFHLNHPSTYQDED